MRCALSMIISLKASLLGKSQEELLIGFRELCLGIDTRAVMMGAIRLYLYPIRYKIPERPSKDRNCSLSPPTLRGGLGYSSMMQHMKTRSDSSISKV